MLSSLPFLCNRRELVLRNQLAEKERQLSSLEQTKADAEAAYARASAEARRAASAGRSVQDPTSLSPGEERALRFKRLRARQQREQWLKERLGSQYSLVHLNQPRFCLASVFCIY